MIDIEKIIFVLGMHRSGTSAITRMLNILGVDLGKHLLKGQTQINEKGFWENKNLIKIHENIFSSLNSSWFDARNLPDNWWEDPDISIFINEIESVLKQDFENQSFIAIKDPRICRLLPLWLEILRKHRISPMCLLIVRNPIEVAQSLAKRDGFDSGIAYYLWLTYVLESEYFSRNLPRTVLNYDDLLTDWEKTASMIADDFGITWPHSISDVGKKIEQEISKKLRHHHANKKDKGVVDYLAQKALDVYEKITTENVDESNSYFDTVRSDIHQLEPIAQVLSDSLFRTSFTMTEKAKKIMEIGDKHTYALSIIKERDQQLIELQEIIKERDQQLIELQEIIKERDQQLIELQEIMDKLRSHWSWWFVRRLVGEI